MDYINTTTNKFSKYFQILNKLLVRADPFIPEFHVTESSLTPRINEAVMAT